MKSKLRWGFKTEANEIARDVRAELGLHPAAPLSPWELAKRLEIPVLRLTELRCAERAAIQYFTDVDRTSFSGVTVFRGRRRIVVHNDSHLVGRQASDLCHELAHALLQHPATPAIDDKGCRYWDAQLEEEAEWLSAALLISDEAAMSIVRRGIVIDEAAEKYGVSKKMVTFRIGVTGAKNRVSRARLLYARR